MLVDKNGREVKIGSKIRIKIPMQDAYDTGRVCYDEEDDTYYYVSRGKAKWSNGKNYWAIQKGEEYCLDEYDDFEVIDRYEN